jgi:hypothetical protein
MRFLLNVVISARVLRASLRESEWKEKSCSTSDGTIYAAIDRSTGISDIYEFIDLGCAQNLHIPLPDEVILLHLSLSSSTYEPTISIGF